MYLFIYLIFIIFGRPDVNPISYGYYLLTIFGYELLNWIHMRINLNFQISIYRNRSTCQATNYEPNPCSSYSMPASNP